MLTGAFKKNFNQHSIIQTAVEILVHDGLSDPVVSVSRVKPYQFEVFQPLDDEDMQVVLEYSATPISERDYHSLDVGNIIKIPDRVIQQVANIDTKPFDKGDDDYLFLNSKQSKAIVHLSKTFKKATRAENGE